MVESIMANSTRSQRKSALKEGVKHLLGELWDDEEEETSHEMFTRDTKKGMHKFLNYSKEELKDLSYREDDESVSHLQMHKVGDARVLFRYLSHSKARDLFP